ncbi:MAG TPA: DUF1697 domain-containing protein [Candidatus Limnocylindrales bacterium]|nr:DUF1697 domain-containing protein [Candidatus Limnocylindrales bacterium]
MSKYVAFLRGINVGGNKKVPMEDLRKTFESLGFTNVKTLLNTGNVVFEGEKTNAETVEQELEKHFGFPISVIIRTIYDIKSLVDSNPFDGIEVTEQTRLYITFLKEKNKSKLKIPYESPELDFKILKVTEGEVISVLTLFENGQSGKGMDILEKEFGKNVTTRNWNTVVKSLNV